jgi:hypothetical protein
MTGTVLDAGVVRHAAIEALHRNDLGTMTTAAPNLSRTSGAGTPRSSRSGSRARTSPAR